MCGYYSEKDAARCVSEMLEAVKVRNDIISCIRKYRRVITHIPLCRLPRDVHDESATKP